MEELMKILSKITLVFLLAVSPAAFASSETAGHVLLQDENVKAVLDYNHQLAKFDGEHGMPGGSHRNAFQHDLSTWGNILATRLERDLGSAPTTAALKEKIESWMSEFERVQEEINKAAATATPSLKNSYKEYGIAVKNLLSHLKEITGFKHT
jgi:hypothetical protein